MILITRPPKDEVADEELNETEEENKENSKLNVSAHSK